MTAIDLYGLAAVSGMLLFYAFERRHAGFVIAFAAACAAASIYGFLIGSWPFGLIEAIWSVVALVRWRRRIRTPQEVAN
ncbi:MAG: hypothetical protein O3C65_09290 [Proteobacteria bacterium]|nr:hypothetical protein [Pseudomonadota bacterium]